jgi:hypothetical protein
MRGMLSTVTLMSPRFVHPELIAEHDRLVDGLQRKSFAARPAQTVKLSPESPERA